MAEIEWVTNNGPSARFRSVCQVPVRLPGSSPSARFQSVCHVPARRPGSSPSARGATAATVPEFSAKWRRSPALLAQVPRLSGAGPKKSWGPAPLESVGDRLAEQDSKRKTDLLRLAGGPAPEEGGPAPPAEGTCAGRRADLLRKRGGGDLRWKKGGPAPEEAGGPAPQPWPVGLAGGSGGGVRNSGTPQSKMRGFRWRCPGFGDTSYTSSVMSSSQVASVSSKVPGEVLSMSSTAVMLPLPLLHPAL